MFRAGINQLEGKLYHTTISKLTTACTNSAILEAYFSSDVKSREDFEPFKQLKARLKKISDSDVLLKPSRNQKNRRRTLKQAQIMMKKIDEE